MSLSVMTQARGLESCTAIQDQASASTLPGNVASEIWWAEQCRMIAYVGPEGGIAQSMPLETQQGEENWAQSKPSSLVID